MYTDFINSIGVSQATVENTLIIGVIAVALGFILMHYWKFIVVGILGFFCLVVFANHSPETKQKLENAEQKIVAPMSDEKMFMEDCVRLTNKKDECADMWKERQES
jgi:hypothetical protein